MRKLIIYVIILLAALMTAAMGAYNVETDDDEYVSDDVYFSHLCTWDKIEAEEIYLQKGKMIFYTGRDNSPERIETAVMPINANNKRVSFRSEDISIAAVDADGVVTPMGKAGDTVIEITCGKAKSKMKISVVRGVEGVEMSQKELTLYADRPAAAQLEAIIIPSAATIRDVTWESADEAIAHVDKDGVVYPNGVGTTEIYVTTEDGGFTAKCAVTVTTWEKPAERHDPVTYADYDITVDEMADIQMTASPTVFTDKVYPAMYEEVLSFVNPENLAWGHEKYQFLNLGEGNDVDADTLDVYLYGKGILSGTGEMFKDAADLNGISEIYLVIHACLESGSGTSSLANGVEYNGTVVYNMFGIGAVDADPIGGGARYAYEQGWTSVEDAIYGGADWISENYINNRNYRQNTLYKMRWNPESPANHQYATDIEWASKQAKDMAAMFAAFPTASYTFDVPVFVGQKRVDLE